MLNLIIIIIIGVAIGASGQIFLKKGVNELGKIDVKINTLPMTIFKILTNKFVLLGLSLSAIAAFFWITALSKINLSVGYPIAGGLFYISVIILSIIFLGEKLNYIQLLGILTTLVGVIILAKS